MLVAVSVTYGLIVRLDDVVEVETASVERMAFPLPDKPSIAVLPFVNMSEDVEQEYFVDGMTEDLITDLSKISGLFVIARNSVFTYKGTPVKVQQVAEDLGVRYVLEGSVRKSGNSVRINAQLIDVVTGGHVWAERYDEAIAEAERAIAVDPNNPLGYEALAATLIYRGLPEDGAEAIREAMRLDPRYPYEYLFWLGLAQFNMEQFKQAAETLQRATQGNPDDDRALILLAAAYGQLGLVEEARFAVEAQDLARERWGAQSSDEDIAQQGIETFLAGPYALENVDSWLFHESSDRERLREGLRLAGF